MDELCLLRCERSLEYESDVGWVRGRGRAAQLQAHLEVAESCLVLAEVSAQGKRAL